MDIYWNSALQAPALFSERLETDFSDLVPVFAPYFNAAGEYKSKELSDILTLMNETDSDKRVCIRSNLEKRLDHHIREQHIKKLEKQGLPDYALKTTLYPYQRTGVEFGLFKTGVLIGDEMGLGKTLAGHCLKHLEERGV